MIYWLKQSLDEGNSTMETKLYWGTAAAEQAAATAFALGKAILAESDTIWGLLTPAEKAGVEELDRLKGRHDKPYLVLMDSPNVVINEVILSDVAQRLIKRFWPGPLTILCKARPGHLVAAQSVHGVVGIRVPDHLPLRQLAGHYGGLFSTSANLAGSPAPVFYNDIPTSIRMAVGATIHNDRAYKANPLPSTIVDCTEVTPKIMREGAITAEILKAYI
jgi:tRNA threonylcarbamoyl adenosine modification protein (Sua5/YciO/YrdC/YwlC family)